MDRRLAWALIALSVLSIVLYLWWSPGSGSGPMCSGNEDSTLDIICGVGMNPISSSTTTVGQDTATCCELTVVEGNPRMCAGNDDSNLDIMCEGRRRVPSSTTTVGQDAATCCLPPSKCSGNEDPTLDFICGENYVLIADSAATVGQDNYTCCSPNTFCSGNVNAADDISCIAWGDRPWHRHVSNSATKLVGRDPQAACCELIQTCSGNHDSTLDFSCPNGQSLVPGSDAKVGQDTEACCGKVCRTARTVFPGTARGQEGGVFQVSQDASISCINDSKWQDADGNGCEEYAADHPLCETSIEQGHLDHLIACPGACDERCGASPLPDELLASDVSTLSIQCDPGYTGGIVATPCANDGEPYTVTGCNQPIMCLRPTGTNLDGYEGQLLREHYLGRDTFNVTWGENGSDAMNACSTGYSHPRNFAQGQGANIERCDENGGEYKLTGCVHDSCLNKDGTERSCTSPNYEPAKCAPPSDPTELYRCVCEDADNVNVNLNPGSVATLNSAGFVDEAEPNPWGVCRGKFEDDWSTGEPFSVTDSAACEAAGSDQGACEELRAAPDGGDPTTFRGVDTGDAGGACYYQPPGSLSDEHGATHRKYRAKCVIPPPVECDIPTQQGMGADYSLYNFGESGNRVESTTDVENGSYMASSYPDRYGGHLTCASGASGSPWIHPCRPSGASPNPYTVSGCHQ